MPANTLLDLKKYFSMKLIDTYAPEEIGAIFRLAVESVYKTDYISVSLLHSKELPDQKRRSLLDILERLSLNEPIQHIIGKALFYELEFRVNKNVLVPRQETELLVHLLIDKLKQLEKPRILDIGTGSGCIAIALKKNIPEANLLAIDISESAIQIARENSILNETSVDFLVDDILNPRHTYENGFELMVSNPPYVRKCEVSKMHANVVKFDPGLALYVEDEDPLIFYREISAFAVERLSAGGLLAFEINEEFGEQTIDTIMSFDYSEPQIIKDLSDKDRFVLAKRK